MAETKQSKEITEVEEKCIPVIADARAFQITTDEGLEKGRDKIRLLKDLKKEVSKTFDPIVEKAHAAHKEAVAGRNKHLNPLNDAEQILKTTIGNYLDVKEREAEKERLRLAEVARKERVKLLDRAAKKIDKLLEKTGDLQAQVVSLEEALQSPEMTEEEEETIQARLRPLYTKIEGAKEQIEDKTAEIETHSMVAEPTSAPTSSPKTKGMSTSKKLEATVVNPMALVKAIASGQAPIGIIKWDIGAINKIVNTGMRLAGTATTTKRVIGVR